MLSLGSISGLVRFRALYLEMRNPKIYSIILITTVAGLNSLDLNAVNSRAFSDSNLVLVLIKNLITANYPSLKY